MKLTDEFRQFTGGPDCLTNISTMIPPDVQLLIAPAIVRLAGFFHSVLARADYSGKCVLGPSALS